MNNAISVRNLTFGYTARPMVNDISFTVQRGEIFGLLGPSGAGKTTLIRLLTGQLTQSSGYAGLLGTDTRRLTAAERRRIGTMMDTFGLYERLSVYDNLVFYADICRASRRVIPELLNATGLYESRRTAVTKLSKGMRGRLALARALINDAALLFLDEPTAGLDPVTSREIHSLLRAQREKGKTIFLTTHNMFEAETLCDHIALLSGGQIIEYGPPRALCRKYDHLHQLHITLRGGETAVLQNGPDAAQAVAQYLAGNQIAAIHSTEPTLEHVFIELTGKGLDSDAEYGNHFQEAAQGHAEK